MWRGHTVRRVGTPAPLAGTLWTTRLRFDARESVSACHREACESRSDVLSGVQRGQASARMAGARSDILHRPRAPHPPCAGLMACGKKDPAHVGGMGGVHAVQAWRCFVGTARASPAAFPSCRGRGGVRGSHPESLKR
jgi:hypothetical protein